MSALSALLTDSNPEGWSAREVARRAQAKGHELSEATATAYFGGRHPQRPKHATLEAFSAVLPVSLARLQAAAGVPRTGEPWRPDEERARLLDEEQRRALDQLIYVMTRRTHDHRDPAPITRARGSRAPWTERPDLYVDEAAQTRRHTLREDDDEHA